MNGERIKLDDKNDVNVGYHSYFGSFEINSLIKRSKEIKNLEDIPKEIRGRFQYILKEMKKELSS